MKKITLLMIYLLFIWFTLDITGLKIGSSLIVSSAFKDEPIDLFFGLFFLYVSYFLSLRIEWVDFYSGYLFYFGR